MGEKITTPDGNGEHKKELPVTQEKLRVNQSKLRGNMVGLEKLPEGFFVGEFLFEKEGYKDASINEAIIMRLKELIQESVNKSLDEKDESASIVAEAIRRLTNKDIGGKSDSVNAAVSEILALDKHKQVHGGQSLNRLDLQNILNLLLINENNYTTSKGGTSINPRLGIIISAFIERIRELDELGYDYLDDVKNDNGDIRAEIKDIKWTALGNINEATTVSEEIALAKKKKGEQKE